MGQGKSREIRTKIASVKNTAKITKAMQLVSASKLRKATREMEQFGPYFESIQMVLHEAIGTSKKGLKLMQDNGSKKALLVLVAGERALCGAFNSNVVKKALARESELISQGYEVSFCAIGKKAKEGLKSFSRSVIREFNLAGTIPERSFSVAISDWLEKLYLDGEFGKIELVCTEVRSAASRSNIVHEFLPLSFSSTSKGDEGRTYAHYYLEPSREAILKHLFQIYMEGRVHQSYVESLAGEYGARMIAMDSASKNANEMIRVLTLKLNRARQAAITQEIAEIVGGAASLE